MQHLGLFRMHFIYMSWIKRVEKKKGKRIKTMEKENVRSRASNKSNMFFLLLKEQNCSVLEHNCSVIEKNCSALEQNSSVF